MIFLNLGETLSSSLCKLGKQEFQKVAEIVSDGRTKLEGLKRGGYQKQRFDFEMRGSVRNPTSAARFSFF